MRGLSVQFRSELTDRNRWTRRAGFANLSPGRSRRRLWYQDIDLPDLPARAGKPERGPGQRGRLLVPHRPRRPHRVAQLPAPVVPSHHANVGDALDRDVRHVVRQGKAPRRAQLVAARLPPEARREVRALARGGIQAVGKSLDAVRWPPEEFDVPRLDAQQILDRADATPPVRLGPRVPLAAIRQLGQDVAAALLRVEELLGPPPLARAPPQLVIGRSVATLLRVQCHRANVNFERSSSAPSFA